MGFIFKEAKGKKFTIRFKLVVLIVLIILVYIFQKPILTSIANFLIIQELQTNTADVILMEEDNLIKPCIEKCNSLYSEKSCKEVWIIRLPSKQNIIPEEKLGKVLKETLDSLGYKFNYRFFYYHIEHPYTFTKSNIISDSLKKYGYSKVILLTEAFHSKRSFNAYKKILIPQGIQIYCSVYYTDYNTTNWWNYADGFRNVISEYMKLIYYWIKGYI
ncbi:MAG: hypothetical protein N2490_00130 [Ignavibacteria bacterium]|nr:hypothetical protein [Ignavibacteria bacterium]